MVPRMLRAAHRGPRRRGARSLHGGALLQRGRARGSGATRVDVRQRLRHPRSGIRAATERALKSVNRDKIYLTIDMDGVDPAYAPAVGNPEPFGLAPLQVKNVIARLAPDLVGMDLNEVSPAWDFGQTTLLAARLIR